MLPILDFDLMFSNGNKTKIVFLGLMESFKLEEPFFNKIIKFPTLQILTAGFTYFRMFFPFIENRLFF